MRAFASVVSALLLAASALAAPGASESVSRPHAMASLVSETAAIVSGKPFHVALHLKLDPGWHVYWKFPGDSGLTTKIEWKLPEGFRAGGILWPAPERIIVSQLVNQGYSGDVYLPVEITPSAAKGPAELAATARWLVCHEECVPGRAELKLSLPEGKSPEPTEWAAPIRRALDRVPRAVAGASAQVLKDGSGGDLLLRVKFPAGAAAPDVKHTLFFPDSDKQIQLLPGQDPTWAADTRELTLKLKPAERQADDEPLAQLSGVLELGGGRAISISAPLPGIAAHAASEGHSSLAFMLVLAFLGGLILNLMPCVFPVLSIKILGFVSLAGEKHGKIRLHGLMFCVGVLVSFWAIGLALFGIKVGGARLGWGFQLQSPAFVAFLAALMFWIGMNLLGVFEFDMAWTRLGSTGVDRRDLAGSFFSGVLATAVATPCTAPFMGAALGFALAQPAWIGFLVFTALALGMSTPYVVLSFFPRLLGFLPRPGAWMETLKQALAFPLLVTAVWLLWVLANQAGPDSAFGVLGGIVLFGVAAWAYGRSQRGRSSLVTATLFFVLGAFVTGYWAVHSEPAGQAGSRATANASLEQAGADEAGRLSWAEWEPARVDSIRGAGRPVFVDFTAAWCLTCKVNERLVLNREDVGLRFREKRVLPMRADWTNNDPRISQFLEGVGRSGVPVYVLYPADPSKPPIVLPEVLTVDALMKALDSV